jgi:hypothetical protein
MNDGIRFELEQYFDGELSPERQADVARLLSEDGEACPYLRRLALLRNVARRRGPVAGRGPLYPPARPRPPRARAVAAAAAALAASVAAVVLWRGQGASDTPGPPAVAAIIAPAPIRARSERLDPIREVELYTWANRNQRRPEMVANAILLSSARPGRRLAVVEVLALDLANAAPGLAEELEPLALLHHSPPGGRARMERHGRRPRPVAPGA